MISIDSERAMLATTDYTYPFIHLRWQCACVCVWTCEAKWITTVWYTVPDLIMLFIYTNLKTQNSKLDHFKCAVWKQHSFIPHSPSLAHLRPSILLISFDAFCNYAHSFDWSTWKLQKYSLRFSHCCSPVRKNVVRCNLQAHHTHLLTFKHLFKSIQIFAKWYS